jgi:hypothetical protein
MGRAVVSIGVSVIYGRLSASKSLNVRNIPFANSVKYLGVIFNMRIKWRLHIEMVTTKNSRTFIIV